MEPKFMSISPTESQPAQVVQDQKSLTQRQKEARIASGAFIAGMIGVFISSFSGHSAAFSSLIGAGVGAGTGIIAWGIDRVITWLSTPKREDQDTTAKAHKVAVPTRPHVVEAPALDEEPPTNVRTELPSHLNEA